MSTEMGAFEKDTLYRMLVEAVRYWIIERFLRAKAIPEEPGVFFIYPDGPTGIGWGNDYRDSDRNRPLKSKRIRVTMTIEDH